MAGEVEVLHYWTSGGEAKSLADLKTMMTGRWHSWKDFTVTGGSGQNAMLALKQRVLAGTLGPSVAHGMAVSSAEQGALRSVVSDFWNSGKTTVNSTLAKLALVAGAKKR